MSKRVYNGFRRFAVGVLAAFMCMVSLVPGAPVYALTNVSVVAADSQYMAMQGDSVVVTFNIRNHSGTVVNGITAKLLTTRDIESARMLGGPVTVQAGGATETIDLEVQTKDDAGSGTRSVTVEFYYNNGSGNALMDTATFNLQISKVQSTSPTSTENHIAAIDVSYKLDKADGLEAGKTNTITLTLFNRGNVTVQDTQVTLGLPGIMTINNSAAMEYLGYVSSGSTRTIKFPVLVDEDADNKNYPIDVKITGTVSGNGSNFDRTLYIPVFGGKTEETVSASDLVIGGITVPQQMPAGDDFNLAFNVRNNGKADIENIKITVSPEEGIINKTKNIFVVSLKRNETKNFSVTLFSKSDAEQKSYPIQITASTEEQILAESNVSADEDGAKATVKSNIGASQISQYASIFIKQLETGDEKTPQLMIDNYSYGGTYVQAGDTFKLNLSLYNTSSKSVTNAKVTVGSEDGTIIPSGGSNSFFIEKIGAKSRTSKGLTFSAKPDAEQKTVSLNVDMTYEDGKGNEFTAKDVISIPVIQEMRLTVDEIMAPPELYVGMPSFVSIEFYNTGKTKLNNLTVTAEGDFDVTESISYYAGNMESGAKDSYDFSFIPRGEGPLEGRIVFTYEDEFGEEQFYEKDFEFNVMAEMPMEDEFGEMQEETQGMSKTPFIILGVVVVLAAAGIAAFKIIRRRKMNKEMEIDE